MSGSAWDYHNETSYDRRELQGHALDWGHQPNVFKAYDGPDTQPLPQDIQFPEVSLSELIRQDREIESQALLDEQRLAELRVLTHSITAKARYGNTDFFYRSVASAGALFPTELYAAVCNVDGVEGGLYHQRVSDQALTKLRTGDVLEEIVKCMGEPFEKPPALVFFLTAIFFRSSWKYRDRAYRYHLLDTGHMAENLVLALRAKGLTHQIMYDFDDVKTNAFLGVDPHREVCLGVVCAWAEGTGVVAGQPMGDLPASSATASRVSDGEIDYPLIREIHAASNERKAREGGAPHMLQSLGLNPGSWKSVSFPETWPQEMTYAGAVYRRRSMRNFVDNDLSADHFGAVVEALCSDAGDSQAPDAAADRCVSVGLLASHVEGYQPGFYLLDRDRRSVSLILKGSFSEPFARICLNQEWLARCALHVIFLTNMEVLERHWGPRGYRYAMLTAGRLGQRLYLATTSMKIGCCGIGAYYDNEAASILGLNDKSRMLYLVATGPVRKWTGQ